MRKSDITFIIPFFGQAPPWMPFFIKSCHSNRDVSFLIFADCLQVGISGNVEVIRLNLADLKVLAEEKLRFRVSLDRPYKICDFRPAFGLIFADYLKGSRFWGTCDVDILLGDIRKFITEDLLSRYDVITAKREYLIGHFTLYRNTRKVNYLFKKSPHYLRVFQNSQAFAFDECNFLWWKLLAGNPIQETRSQIESMSHVVKRLAVSGYICAYFRSHVIEQDQLTSDGQLEAFTKTLIWENGRLMDARENQEYISFHFHFMKKQTIFNIPDWEEIPERFAISQAGFSYINECDTCK
ncbi:hypothetical protein FEM33_15160 [Dyadobacter flavalbus]|uniref:Glycosyl transferase n=1 Tax=Dyadobacter flavalbus TaxID=2579942 RepID=A0A5M8QUF4_9BACT|nr:DUF6625 family protein [Dyadobacter flavalbus]KAA6438908.1 hypothetical protein FEM33_15160 [Dyadobacter flavalbus]